MILVGDSLGQVVLGYETTVTVTMDEMLHHTRAVVRGTKRALVIGDMPFLYLLDDRRRRPRTPGKFMQDGGAQAVKVEGGVRSARIVEALVKSGVPVMGHIGWTPQSQHGLGGKVKVQGKTRDAARSLLSDAIAIQQAGAFSIVLELVPEQLSAVITSRLTHPDDRHRCRPALLRPGPGHPGHARPRRLPSEARARVRGPPGHDRRRHEALDGRRRRRHVPRRRPRPSAWTTRCSTRRSAGTPTTAPRTPIPIGIPLDRDL